jgi:5-methylcytosine-specific restriction enzyme A
MDGIIDKINNPFIKDSWIEQGYSFTQDRQELAPRLFKRSTDEIKKFKEENYYSYPAFVAIRWGFAFLRNNILFPTYKWNHREYYNGYGEPQSGFNISDIQAEWENEFNIRIFETYDLAKKFGYTALRYLQKIRKDGGVKSSKYWLNPKKKEQSPSKGFQTLIKKDKLDISLEALVLRYPFNNLFTKEELDVARSRLLKGGYNGPELYGQTPDQVIAEEIVAPENYQEGAKHSILVNAYERNLQARAACIKHFGAKCSVCGFKFEDNYGDLFKDYIHVHHLMLLSQIGEKYTLNPLTDLRPVCPNCHAIIHKKDPPYTIDEVKEFIIASRQ